MIRNQLNYYIGIALLISVISFAFYKSLFEDRPLNQALDTIEEIHDLQVQLHRDMLRYRSNQIQQYDTLNSTIRQLDTHIVRLTANSTLNEEIGTSAIRNLERSITHQSLLVEDFKTHHSILQNSLFYIYNLSNYLYSYTPKPEISVSVPGLSVVSTAAASSTPAGGAPAMAWCRTSTPMSCDSPSPSMSPMG